MENLTSEEKVIKIKKDLIKNIAIIFLSVMLILTFFSNSIMNRSLPEVATKYVENNSITEAVRGTGTVTADDPYSVMIQESRIIGSVAVHEGDMVEKDDVLFYLEDSESAELEEAQKALEDLIYKYTVGALTGEMTDGAYKDATAGRVQSMNSYEFQIEAARTRVKNAQDAVDSLTRQMAYADNTTDITNKNLELDKAKTELASAETVLTAAQAEYDAAKAAADAGVGSEEKASFAALEAANAQTEYNGKAAQAKSKIESDATALSDLKISNEVKYGALATAQDLANMIFAADNSIKDASALNDWRNVNSVGYSATELDALTAAYKDYTEKKAAAEVAEAAANEYKKAKSSLNSKASALAAAKNKANELKTKVDALSNALSDNTASNSNLKSSLAQQKTDADIALAKAKEDQAQLLLDISKTLDLTNQNSIIREQQEKVTKLREKSIGATILAPVAGKIMSVNKTAGEKTTADEALATIQVAGKGMMLSFSVTTEQAKKVRVGDQAQLQNAWYYDGVSAILTKIINDPDNPSGKKKLVFSIDGDVNDGENLSLSIGQRSREYDMVVPNSAVREDNGGKFILIIEEKNTPFGNRYKAKRVDVTVEASDDINSAIVGEVDSWSYVITTSDKPVKAGQQVRLTDSN